MKTGIAFCVIAIISGLVAQFACGQEPARTELRPAATVVERVVFQSEQLGTTPATPRIPRVDIRLWSVAGGQKLTPLRLPFKGVLIVESRGGRLTTIVDGRRVARKPGEIWSVPAGTELQIETDDDMATFQTTLIGR